MTSNLRPYTFLLVATLVSILSFTVSGPFNMRIDGEVYTAQVDQFEKGSLSTESHDVELRAFKPFPGIWGSIWVPLLTPEQSLQLLNLLFLFGLPFVAFRFLRELDFNEVQSFWGSLWITTGYPLLKYGLAISTDIGAWFFALASAYLGLKGIRTQSIRTIVLASLVGFIGGTIKEPGVFGLLLVGFFLCFTFRERPFRSTLLYILALGIPAILLEGILMITLLKAGLPTFLDWYGVVVDTEFKEKRYHLGNMIGVYGSAFNILLIYAVLGTFSIVRGSMTVWSQKQPIARTCALLCASLPVLLWTVFIGRVLYIQFLFFVPLALVGLGVLRRSGMYETLLYLLPIVCSVSLFLIAWNGSLFEMF